MAELNLIPWPRLVRPCAGVVSSNSGSVVAPPDLAFVAEQVRGILFLLDWPLSSRLMPRFLADPRRTGFPLVKTESR